MAFEFFLFEFFSVAFLGVLCEFFCLLAVSEFLIVECDFAVEFAEFADGFEFHIHFGDCFDERSTGEFECLFSFLLILLMLELLLMAFFAVALDAFLAFLLLAFLFGSLGEFFLAFLVLFFPDRVIDGVVEVKVRVAVFDDTTRSFVFGVV